MARILQFLLFGIALFACLLFFRGLIGPRRSTSSKARSRAALDKGRMVKDLICETYVPETAALRLADNGKMYYFCSESCRRLFKANRKPDYEPESDKTTPPPL